MTSLRSRPLPGVQSQAEGLSPLCVLSHSVVSNSLCPTKLLCPWNSPGNNTAVGGHFLLQGIFLTQGSNLRLLQLLHGRADSLPLSHLGSLRRAQSLDGLPAWAGQTPLLAFSQVDTVCTSTDTIGVNSFHKEIFDSTFF